MFQLKPIKLCLSKPELHNFFLLHILGKAIFPERGIGGFCYTREKAFGVLLIANTRPSLTATVRGLSLTRILDTGSNFTVFLSEWPKALSSYSFKVVSDQISPELSINILLAKRPNGKTATVKHFILPMPCTLWWQDALQQWILFLNNQQF